MKISGKDFRILLELELYLQNNKVNEVLYSKLHDLNMRIRSMLSWIVSVKGDMDLAKMLIRNNVFLPFFIRNIEKNAGYYISVRYLQIKL